MGRQKRLVNFVMLTAQLAQTFSAPEIALFLESTPRETEIVAIQELVPRLSPAENRAAAIETIGDAVSAANQTIFELAIDSIGRK